MFPACSQPVTLQPWHRPQHQSIAATKQQQQQQQQPPAPADALGQQYEPQQVVPHTNNGDHLQRQQAHLQAQQQQQRQQQHPIKQLQSASPVHEPSTHLPGQCRFGSLKGTWVSGEQPGARWQLLDRACQLRNLLALYAGPVNSSSIAASDLQSSTVTSEAAQSAESGGYSQSSGYSAPTGSEEPTAEGALQSSSSGSGGSSSGSSGSSGSTSSVAGMPTQPHMARILLLSDSVDRFTIQHWCEYIGGTKATETMMHYISSRTASSQPPLHGAGGSNLNKTAYAFHTCATDKPLKIASSYFPGESQMLLSNMDFEHLGCSI